MGYQEPFSGHPVHQKRRLSGIFKLPSAPGSVQSKRVGLVSRDSTPDIGDKKNGFTACDTYNTHAKYIVSP